MPSPCRLSPPRAANDKCWCFAFVIRNERFHAAMFCQLFIIDQRAERRALLLSDFVFRHAATILYRHTAALLSCRFFRLFIDRERLMDWDAYADFLRRAPHFPYAIFTPLFYALSYAIRHYAIAVAVTKDWCCCRHVTRLIFDYERQRQHVHCLCGVMRRRKWDRLFMRAHNAHACLFIVVT